MPFKPTIFLETVSHFVDSAVIDKFDQACRTYTSLTHPQQKADCLNGMMKILEGEVDGENRITIMQTCGRKCIGASTIAKAIKIRGETENLDDLLNRLNAVHIGGGHLARKGEVILASYDRCYCGSVSKTKKPFSETYCYCSCGWYQQLFEVLYNRPVKVDLIDSIIQGGGRCQFQILISE